MLEEFERSKRLNDLDASLNFYFTISAELDFDLGSSMSVFSMIHNCSF